MSLLNRLMSEMNHYYTRPWPIQTPAYLGAFDGIETFTKTDTGYYMEIMVPGFAREDLLVDIVNERYLLVVGKSSSHKTARQFAQKWLLPIFVDISSIQATAKNGILTIEMNKKEPVPPKPNTYRVDIH